MIAGAAFAISLAAIVFALAAYRHVKPFADAMRSDLVASEEAMEAPRPDPYRTLDS